MLGGCDKRSIGTRAARFVRAYATSTRELGSSRCSMDEAGLTRLAPKPLKPFKSTDEYIYAMKEDLACWFNALYGTQLAADCLLSQLEDGVVLCQHANSVCSYICAANGRATEVSFRRTVKPKSFQARDNVANFIAWLRGNLGMKDTVLFETDDLVLSKNEKSVVFSLLEVARRGAKYGMLAPLLVQFEQEIERTDSTTNVQSDDLRRQGCHNDQTLDELVRNSLRKCTCPSQFPMIQVSEGKYKLGDSQTTVFVRVLRSHVMIRVGGGWDTLERYLDKHDPCRCRANGHRRGSIPMDKPVKVLPSKYSLEGRSSVDPERHRSIDLGYQTTSRDANKKPSLHKRFYSTANVHESSQLSLRRQGRSGSNLTLAGNGANACSKDLQARPAGARSGRSTPRECLSSSLVISRDQTGKHHVSESSSTPVSPGTVSRSGSPLFFSNGSRPCSPARRRINRLSKNPNHQRSVSEPCENLTMAHNCDAIRRQDSPTRRVFSSPRKDKLVGKPTRIPGPVHPSDSLMSPDSGSSDPSKWNSSMNLRKVDSGVEMTSDDSDTSLSNGLKSHM